MKQEEIEMLAQLRSYVIGYYKKLDGGGAPDASVVKQEDVALFLESVVKSMDAVLSPYVNFS